jgi:eukaryotic-like serine/threonine-protein kinase
VNPFRLVRRKKPNTEFEMLEVISNTAHIQIERGIWRSQPVLVKRLLEMASRVPEVVERFEREADVLERLDHPNIGQFTHREPGVLMREYIEGRTLYYHLEQGPLMPRRALRVIRGVLAAIAHAHSKDIIHLDLKPANILLEPDDRVRVIDFGCAKDLTLEAITHHEARLGTPHYMAPEQFKGVRDDPRSDLYSIGAVLYELSMGKPPFSPDPFAWLAGRGKMPEQWPNDKKVAEFIRMALDRDPNNRYHDAHDMLTALEALEDYVPAS